MAPLAVDVDGIRIGVRGNDDDAQAWIADLLADHVVGDTAVAPNYSVHVGRETGSLHLLYWGGCLVARCRTLEELSLALRTHLAGHAPPGTGVVRLDATALHSDGEAVVLARVDHTTGAKIAGRLRQDGVWVEVRAWVDIDVDSGRLVPVEPLRADGGAVTAPAAMVTLVGLPRSVFDTSPADQVALLVHHRIATHIRSLDSLVRFRRVLPTKSVDDYSPDALVAFVSSGFSGSA